LASLHSLIHPDVLSRLERLEIPFGPQGFDPYGAGKTELGLFFTALRPFYRRYFTVHCHGISNIPARGRAMLVSNHSGGMPLDALMVLASVFFELEPPRLGHGMADKFVAALPLIGQIAARIGQPTGLPEHALRLLEDERLLVVFPEGHRGTAKLYPQRHTLVHFGSGFMRLALETHSPIVPVACLGVGSAVPTIFNARGLGHLFGVPYFPLTPYGLPIPLPAHIDLVYGPPMDFHGTGSEEDEVVEGYVNQVKAAIATMIARARPSSRTKAAGVAP
jgi:1-acyl-sn-glycerol-3-phosphate acyltransferase